RILTQQEVLEGYTAFGKHLTFDFIESAFSRGDICNGVLVDGQWVGFDWRSYTCAPHGDGLWVRFKRPYRYGYKGYVMPEYRGLRIMDTTASDAYCISKGFSRTVLYIDLKNLPSLKNNLRRDFFERYGFVFILRLFGKRYLLHTPGLKKIGFEFYEHDPDCN
ncbi:MAG: hypothetical protein AAF541_23585, partial [Pseudomonadota bacterium]